MAVIGWIVLLNLGMQSHSALDCEQTERSQREKNEQKKSSGSKTTAMRGLEQRGPLYTPFTGACSAYSGGSSLGTKPARSPVRENHESPIFGERRPPVCHPGRQAAQFEKGGRYLELQEGGTGPDGERGENHRLSRRHRFRGRIPPLEIIHVSRYWHLRHGEDSHQCRPS
jgi:hypothetical protein